VVVCVICRLTRYQVFRVRVPAVVVDVMDMQVRPQRLDLAVCVPREPLEVDGPVFPGFRIPPAKSGIVYRVELDARADYPDG